MSDLITDYATAAIDLQQMKAQKDGAYLERNRCVALIARMAIAAGLTAGTARTAIEGWSADWHGCVYVDLPTAQGFPDSYIIDRGHDGRVLPKDAQVRMCGNSVCPPLAEALVAANYTERQALRAAA
jgi:site-specific DNA-cytosine methylase